MTPTPVNPVLPVAAKRGLGALASLGILIVVLGVVKEIPGFWGAFLMSFYLLVGAGPFRACSSSASTGPLQHAGTRRSGGCPRPWPPPWR